MDLIESEHPETFLEILPCENETVWSVREPAEMFASWCRTSQENKLKYEEVAGKHSCIPLKIR